MLSVLRFGGQAVVYAAIAALIGYLSNSPPYTHFPPDLALVKLSFSHAAKRKEECRQRTAEELAALPRNMRKPLECKSRGRLPVRVELLLDEKVLYAASLPPTGLSGDGPARVYQQFPVQPGHHHLVARLADSARSDGFDHVGETDVDLTPQQSLAVDFRAETGGFIFK